MGCAQETFDKILGFLHREHVDPNYLETYCAAKTKESRWKIDDILDDMGCSPQCAAHSVFGIQSIDLTRCDRCNIVDDVSEAKSEFIEQFYVHEMLQGYDELPSGKKDIHTVFRKIIKGDCDFKIQNREEQKKCSVCKVPLKLEDKWLLELPQIFPLGL